MEISKVKFGVGLFSAVLATSVAVPIHAKELDLTGKTVNFVIPFAETGGSASWANFFAPLLSDALPGKPKVLVKYMPGAGSTKGANWFQNQKDDGLTIFGTSGSTQFPYLLKDKRVRYEYKDWHVVLSSATGGVAYLPPEAGAKFQKDPNSIKGMKVIYGSQGITALDLVPILAWKMLGMNVEPVFGVKGRGDGRLMFERGEANIDYQTSSAYIKNVEPLVKMGKAVPMMSWGALDENGKIVRDPSFPDLPSFKEVLTKQLGKEPSGPVWDAWKSFFIAGFAAQKMVFLPKGSSKDSIETYSKAFERVVNKPDFKKKSDKLLGVYPQMVNKSAVAAFKEAVDVSDEAREYVRNWLKTEYKAKL
mgnify:CR=1 FL=1